MDEKDRIGTYQVIVEECKGPNRNRKYVRESWYDEDNELHRIDGPAVTVKDLKGNVILSEWYRFGKLDRDDGPAQTYTDGTYLTETWFRHGHLNRFKGGPAKTVTHILSGIITEEIWAVMGVEGNFKGPACIYRSEKTGVVTCEHWKINGRTHRNDDKPALIERDENTGAITFLQWFWEDKLHCTSGPASIRYNSDGTIAREWYYREGNPVPKEQPTGLAHDMR